MHIDIVVESKVGAAQFKELGLLAEELGFHRIWIQNYAQSPDAFLTAMPLALATQKIRIGVAVVSSYELHPLKIANSVLTLNEAAQGRAAVVVTGGGEWPSVMKVNYGKRKTVLYEALEIIRQACGDDVVKFSGEIHNAQAFSTSWTTQNPPLIYAGVNGPSMARMAVGVADGIMMSDVQPEMFNWSIPILEKSIIEAGRANDNFRLNNFLSWHVKQDREESFRESRRELIIRAWLGRRWIEPFLDSDAVETVRANMDKFMQAYMDRSGDIKGIAPEIIDALVEGLMCSGDLSDMDQHIERLIKFQAAGFTEIALGLQDDPADSMRMIAEHVLPAMH
jgi:alkanesulfonate monooxygenase SsuD/methylene tetrahydromethanopterin reductase-like flavin-dependent oxidoreductase (luciferase family)